MFDRSDFYLLLAIHRPEKTASGFAKNIDSSTNQIANAQAYLSAIDIALETVATKRSKIGAFQNRLNSAIDTLTVNIENLSAARSTIQDTDVAVESSNYIKNQILQQSTTAMLSAANQAPQVALSLIG